MGFEGFDLFRKKADEKTKKPLILIIDDDVSVRESMRIILRDKYRVVLCSSGEQGIQDIQKEVDAVILDIKMPGQDGFQTCKQISKKFPQMPIIFFSAYQDLKDPFEIMNDYHPFGYIKKGVDNSEILDLLGRAVNYSKLYCIRST
ncbi:response regulator [bacterium]|jgi:DNA-binding NtrC family response regulator|nr:response regulator [bacterium]